MSLIAVNRASVPFDEISPYSYICNLFFPGVIANDRFDWLTKFSLLDWAEVGQLKSFKAWKDQDFISLAERRCSAILSSIKNKKLVLSWSGGVDSTFLLVLFAERKPADLELEVYCTVDSIHESPIILEYLDYLNIKSHIAPRRKLWECIEKERDYFLVSAQCADQCFAFKVLNQFPQLYTLPWQDAVEKYIDLIDRKERFIYHKRSKEAIEQYVSNFGIKTWAQFCIFWNNCIKSNFTGYNDTLLATTDYLRENNLAFFHTADFLNWGLTNAQNLDFDYIQNPKQYKPQMKAYIKSVLHTDFFDTKPKTPSYMFDSTLRVFSVIDTEGVRLFEPTDSFTKYRKLLTLYRKEGY